MQIAETQHAAAMPMKPYTLRRWEVAGAFVFNILAVVVVAWILTGLYNQGHQAHGALCALKADLELRVASSEDFLREHPKGIPGIPTATLVQSITNQQSTLAALAPLACKETP